MGKPVVLSIFSLSVAAFSAQMTTIQLTGGQHRYIIGQYWYSENLDILKCSTFSSVEPVQNETLIKVKENLERAFASKFEFYLSAGAKFSVNLLCSHQQKGNNKDHNKILHIC